MGRCAASESGRLLVDLRAGLVEIPSRTVSDRWSPGSCVLDTMDERPGLLIPRQIRIDFGSATGHRGLTHHGYVDADPASYPREQSGRALPAEHYVMLGGPA